MVLISYVKLIIVIRPIVMLRELSIITAVLRWKCWITAALLLHILLDRFGLSRSFLPVKDYGQAINDESIDNKIKCIQGDSQPHFFPVWNLLVYFIVKTINRSV